MAVGPVVQLEVELDNAEKRKMEKITSVCADQKWNLLILVALYSIESINKDL